MKSKITTSLFVLMLAIGACKKDTTSQTASEISAISKKTTAEATAITTSNRGLRVNTLGDNNSYVDLEVLSGVTPTTYHCVWSNVDIYVIGPYWDSATYPGLSTGYPLYANDVHSGSTSTAPFVTYASQTGVTGTVFTVTIPTVCGGVQNLDKLAQDIAKFQDSLNTYKFVGTPHNLNEFVQSDYGSAGCPQTTLKLKLIRSTTSSTGFAVATAAYPVFPVVPSGYTRIGTLYSTIVPGLWYDFLGFNGIINRVKYYINGNLIYGTATGTYYMDGGGDTHLSGTFVDENGATVPFSVIQYAN